MKFWIILDEAFNWLLFASLAFLLAASAPGWVKELPRSIFVKPAKGASTEAREAPVD